MVPRLILYKRISEHRNKVFKNSFTLKYNIDKIVYFESFSLAEHAFLREKQIKAGSGKRKIELIGALDPKWQDLFELLKGGQTDELIRIKKFLR